MVFSYTRSRAEGNLNSFDHLSGNFPGAHTAPCSVFQSPGGPAQPLPGLGSMSRSRSGA